MSQKGLSPQAVNDGSGKVPRASTYTLRAAEIEDEDDERYEHNK